MAEKVNTFPEHRCSGYDWDTWFDGSVWKLTIGVDVLVSIKSFRALLYQTARRRGIKLKTRLDGDAFYLQKTGVIDVAE